MKMTSQQFQDLGPTRYGYLLGSLSRLPIGRHLDYGCFDGQMLERLAEREVIELGVGCDLNEIAVKRPSHPLVHLHHIRDISGVTDLVQRYGLFDSASLLDVLEHVHDQRALLGVLHASLKPGAQLVVTVPQQHVFSWMDIGNVKFRFPRIHKWLYRLRHSEAEYLYRYVDNPSGLIGDVEARKAWHQHFRPEELVGLLADSGFEVTETDGAGLLHRPLGCLKILRLPVDRLIELDARRWSKCHLFVTARRVN
jgi:2-polyprenyl-3-methyl-5-hydroxy-6-metoxy-1,4-benzoquinol methylase